MKRQLSQSMKTAIAQETTSLLRKQRELKHFDYASDTTGGGTTYLAMTPNTAYLHDPGQISNGPGDGARVGDQIDLDSIEYNVLFKFGPQTIQGASPPQFIATTCAVRFLIVQFHGNSFTSGFFSVDVLQSTSINTTEQFQYWTEKGLVTVLHEEKAILGMYSNSGAWFSGKIKPPVPTIQYVGGTTEGTNKLYCVLVADNQAAPNGIYYFCNFRTTYSDS